MHPEKFNKLFEEISNIFTLEKYAEVLNGKSINLNENYPKFDSKTKVWDVLDNIGDAKFLDLGDGKYVYCEKLVKKPIRILSFVKLVEFEGRIYRILEWLKIDTNKLDKLRIRDYKKNLKEEITAKNLFSLQIEYSSEKEFYEDIDYIIDFRNDVMHVNKILQSKEIGYLNRRIKRIERLLKALQEITDGLNNEYRKG